MPGELRNDRFPRAALVEKAVQGRVGQRSWGTAQLLMTHQGPFSLVGGILAGQEKPSSSSSSHSPLRFTL